MIKGTSTVIFPCNVRYCMAAGATPSDVASAAEPAILVKFWGVTGSYSDPWQPRNTADWLVRVLRTLGERNLLSAIQDRSLSNTELQELLRANLDSTLLAGPRRQTTCIEIRTPTTLNLIDGGSGLQDYMPSPVTPSWSVQPTDCHLWLTHGHWDHLLGLPFYSGFYTAERRFTVWGSERVLDLLRLMFDRDSKLGETLIPTNFEHLRALRELRVLNCNDCFQISGMTVRTLALNHPAGSLAYRFEAAGRTVVIATDHEQDSTPSPDALIDFARGADLLYIDAQYTQAEYEGQAGIAGEMPRVRRGWGHSTLESAVAVGVAAGVKRLCLGHHDPRRSDSELEQLEQSARSLATKLLVTHNRPADTCRIELARAGISLLL